jgi:hypothetical protein
MAQDLTVNIKTTSDVPQAMDRAKTATDSFGKQVEGISKKFGSSFKDIFLSFLGPMALITGAFTLISKLIEEQKQQREDANRAAIEGTNALMSAEDRYYANKRNNEKKAKENIEEAKTAREGVTEQFLETKAGEKIVVREMMARSSSTGETSTSLRDLARDPKVQAEVQALIAEDMKKNPGAGATAESSAAIKGSTTFKGPEGFSNVVGVGANPVMEAMNAQLEESRKQTALLQQIASPNGSVPADFTKSTSPSRAALLRGAL